MSESPPDDTTRTGAKGKGAFTRVGWDEALDDIATRLTVIAARDPQRIVPYSYAGTTGLVQGESMAARFFHKLGASFLDRTIPVGLSGPRSIVDGAGHRDERA
jgi:anaerobic selenocysteine-containing dehydrogenase